MMVRFGAATCGVVMAVACSSAATREPDIVAVDPYAAEIAAGGKSARTNVTNDGEALGANASTTPGLCSELRLKVSTHESWLAPLAVIALELDKRNATPMGGTIIGTASTYNPYRPGYRSGGPQTASGETYDPTAWTAAIQIDLREMFGGIRHGKSYRPTYAVVESGDKQAIVKINDVGPLRPGRIIDLNEQTMRYFDPTLDRGVIPAVKVTPLPVDDCSPGPLDHSV